MHWKQPGHANPSDPCLPCVGMQWAEADADEHAGNGWNDNALHIFIHRHAIFFQPWRLWDVFKISKRI